MAPSRSRWLALALLLTACSADSTSDTDARCTTNCTHDGSATDAAHDARLDTAVIDTGPSNTRDLASVVITPTDSVLSIQRAQHTTQNFQAIGTRNDGTMTGALTGVWSLSNATVGTIDSATGIFTASGDVGGDVAVHVEVAGTHGNTLSADTSLSVHLHIDIIGPGAPPDAASHFTATPTVDPTRAPQIVYPVDGAVMPQNVYAADLQWVIPTTQAVIPGVQGDIFRIQLISARFQLTGYVMDSGPAFQADWQIDPSAWSGLAGSSTADEAVSVTVDRWIAASNVVVTNAPITIQFAGGSVIGSVYYWDIAAGRSIRIDDGTNARIQYMPNPPAGVDGAHCVGCHSISADGRWFIGRLGGGDNIGAVFDLTRDLTGNPPPTTFQVSATSVKWWFASFNPTATRMIAEENQALLLIDPMTGTIFTTATAMLPASIATHPSWSPDGSSIAFVTNINDWGGNFTHGDIAVMSANGGDTFGTPVVIHSASDLPSPNAAVGNADSYPTWTPDSHWIAFAHGSGSRSEVHQDSLFIMGANGSNVVRLDKASGTGTDTFQPHFSPFDVGGYYWVSFLSKRAYGNPWAGTSGSARQQVWVAAINDHPTPGVDASSVAFWLPGQNTASQNISAFWAPRPCRQDGAGCDVGSECCSQMCGTNAGGDRVCSPPPIDQCRMLGQLCGGSGCCPGLDCEANVCSHPPG